MRLKDKHTLKSTVNSENHVRGESGAAEERSRGKTVWNERRQGGGKWEAKEGRQSDARGGNGAKQEYLLMEEERPTCSLEQKSWPASGFIQILFVICKIYARLFLWSVHRNSPHFKSIISPECCSSSLALICCWSDRSCPQQQTRCLWLVHHSYVTCFETLALHLNNLKSREWNNR